MSSFSRRVSIPKTLSTQETVKILRVTSEHSRGYRDHMIIATALGTALREHEIANLSIGDVAIANEIRTRVELRVFKKKPVKKVKRGAKPLRPPIVQKGEGVFLPKTLRHKLSRYLTWKRRRGEPTTPESPLFMSSRGVQISTRMMRHMWREWQRKAGFETLHGFHALRHTCLTNLYQRTKDLRLVQGQARHTSSITTEIYTHVSEDDMRRAVDRLPC